MPKRSHLPLERPSTIGEALDRATLALRTGRFDEAVRLAADVLKSNQGNVLAAQVLGQALMLQNRPDEAIRPLQRVARRSQDPVIETLLGRAMIDAGRGDEGAEQLRLATTRRPPYPLAFLELGDWLGDMGRFEEGMAVFESGRTLAPDAIVLRVGLGYLHLKHNDRAKARALFQQLCAAAPERTDAAIGLANVLVLDGDYATAADLYRRALQLRPGDAVTRINLGKCLLELGGREAGETALRAAVRGASQLSGLAITALAATPHGRLFLRPSAAAKFLGAQAS